MIEPPLWSSEQLAADRLRAISHFRKERMEEPLEGYLQAFDEYRANIEDLLRTTADLAQLQDRGLAVLTDMRLQEAFRYLAAPPISEDDLKILAEAPSLTAGQLRKKPDDVRRLVEIVRLVLDRRRFVWVLEGREPTGAERSAAVMASAALLAASRAQTKRRTAGKSQQEALVKQALRDLGLREVAARPIPNVSLAPAAGEFCAESMLGEPKAGRNADVVLRLRDQRLMPIECKVSNSSLNSVKRLNNDAAVKAVTWRRDFGLRQVVPAAVLSGVYNLHNLADAQQRGLTLFWAFLAISCGLRPPRRCAGAPNRWSVRGCVGSEARRVLISFRNQFLPLPPVLALAGTDSSGALQAMARRVGSSLSLWPPGFCPVSAFPEGLRTRFC